MAVSSQRPVPAEAGGRPRGGAGDASSMVTILVS